MVHDFSLDTEIPPGIKGGLNSDTNPEEIPGCLCGETLPKLPRRALRLRKKSTNKQTLLSKADATRAFWNVRVAADQVCKRFHDIDDISVQILHHIRLTVDPQLPGLILQAVAHAQCHTKPTDLNIL